MASTKCAHLGGGEERPRACRRAASRRRRRPTRRRCARPWCGRARPARSRRVRGEPGTCDQLVVRPATRSCTCAWVMPGTGFAGLVTRQTPLSAIGVSVEPGRVLRGQVAADHAGAGDAAGGVGDPGLRAAADDLEARRVGCGAAVEVGQVGDDGQRGGRAAERDRRLARRAAASRARAVSRRRGERGGDEQRLDHVPTPRPRVTPRLPARSWVTRRVAVASLRPDASSASMRTRLPAPLQRDGEGRAARGDRGPAAVEPDAVALDGLRRAADGHLHLRPAPVGRRAQDPQARRAAWTPGRRRW